MPIMNKSITWLWCFLGFGLIFLGGVLLSGCNYPSNEDLAKQYGVTLGPGVSQKIRGIKLGFRIDMEKPMEMHTSGSRSLASPVGSSTAVDKNIVYYQEERLISVNSNGCSIRFIVNWQPVSKHEGGQVTDEGSRSTNTIFFYFGQITQTNISGLRIIGQYED